MARENRNDSTAIDGMVWTHLVNAFSGIYTPEGQPDPRLREQEVAVVRLSFWGVEMYIPPTVQVEVGRIRDPCCLQAHRLLRNIVLEEIQAEQLDKTFIAQRVAVLSKFHKGRRDQGDCRIVAEAEAAWPSDIGFCPGRIARLLTLDDGLRKHLTGHALVALVEPAAYWEELAIPRGTRPRWTPAPSNPLSQVSWWRW